MSHSPERWQHDHVFLGESHELHERRTWAVVALTLVMMAGEIAGGALTGSMALLADGFHMATHAGALGIAALAYSFARKYARHARFSYGTGKLGELAAFASAIILALVALLIGYESVERLIAPVPIRFGEAIAIAVLGLAVNVASAWLLADDDHPHGDAPGHRHHDHHADYNARAAYVHVLADTLTSVLAIAALLVAWQFGWTWPDPVVGIVGMIVILSWSWTLVRAAGAVLLDVVPSPELAERIRGRLEQDDDVVTDFHVWRLGPGHLGVHATILADDPRPPDHYKARLAGIDGLSHVTIEVQPCPEHAAARAG